MTVRTILMLFFIWFSSFCFCQDNSIEADVASSVDLLEDIWLDEVVFLKHPGVEVDLSEVDSLVNSFVLGTNPYGSQLLDEMGAKLEMLKKDWGLSLKGGFLENFNAGVGEPDENISYSRRYSLGAEWSVLENGFFENRRKITSLENSMIVENEVLPIKKRKDQYQMYRYAVVYVFNREKIRLLKTMYAKK